MRQAVSAPKPYDIRALIRPLKRIAGDRFVLDAPEELLVYECDGCTLVKTRPEVVVIPADTAEVAAVVKLCAEYRIPFVARGSGTGLSGGALPMAGGVVISLARMNRVVSIDPENRTATVETGIINAWLNRELAEYGLFYAPDPSSQSACTIGGNVAENAGGIHCVKYGVTTDHVLGLEVVLPDGRITWLGSQSRSVHGLNLTGLFVGSEGTLGIATRAVLRLLPRPQSIRAYLAAFDQVSEATDAVADIVQSGVNPAALEFMDAFTVKAVNRAFGVGFPETSEAVLLVEVDGTDEQVVYDEKRLKAILEKHRALDVRTGVTEVERNTLWQARKKAVAAYGRYFPAFYLHDTVIPRSQLTHLLTRIIAIAGKHNVTVGNVFHAGDGNLHPNLLYDPADKEMVKRVLAAGEEILAECLAVGGTLSGEHGIGIEKSAFMPRIFTDADLEKMRLVKAVFDPDEIANPEKIFPVRKGCGEVNKQLNPVQQLAAVDGEMWI